MKLAHPPANKIRELAESLIGTIGNQEDRDKIEELTIEECHELDELAFECAGCNWWCDDNEKHEIDDEWFCNDCAKEREPVED